MRTETVAVKRGETLIKINKSDLKEGEKILTGKQIEAEKKKK